MTGKDLKETVAMIPDDANVAIGICEKKEGNFYEPDIITEGTVMTDFNFLTKEKESTLIFTIEGGKGNGCHKNRC